MTKETTESEQLFSGLPTRSTSSLENQFLNVWRMLTHRHLEQEYRFDATRRWRMDFAEPSTRVCVEIEGGTATGGRHTRPAGYAKDCEKYNAAQEQGWLVYRLTADMLRIDPWGWAQRILASIEKREAERGGTP